MISIDRSQHRSRILAGLLALAALCLPCATAAQSSCGGDETALDEEDIVNLAMAEALNSDVVSDLPVEDLTANVRSVDDVWEVTFQDPDFDPNMLGDGGFLVRLSQPCGHLLELLRYQ